MKNVSIIIPIKKINPYFLNDLISALKKQSYRNFEIIIADKPPPAGPALKRDLAAKKAKGKILAFIDDDAYPHKNWLKNALPYFENHRIAAVCGPGITPPADNLKQKVSGYILSSFLGAGGAGTYRSRPEKKREVNDYPTFNLIVRKSDFEKVGGFNTKYWPGEDTKLCYDLVYKIKKEIIYDPRILVYHHRKEIFLPHLKQMARFGLHRGYFVKIFPKTSRRIGYFLPSLFCLFLLTSPLIIFNKIVLILYFLIINLYGFLLLINSFIIWQKTKSFKMAILTMLAIFFTHLIYGFTFLKGLLIKKLKN